jgi:8-oxo-dGTP pyrophosphatase MutT (NUDIX family)
MATMRSSTSRRSLRDTLVKKSKSAVSFRRSRTSKRQLDQLREQVAAVCFRIHDDRLEFLLVQTRRSGRWIFPKGGVEPGLTRSQSAAQEALEEAGVHGSIEEAPFARYAIEERGSGGKSSKNRAMIAAYLCAVAWLTEPHEANRNPTWFSPEEAKKRFGQYRERHFSDELCRVLDRAVMRVERLQSCAFTAKDALRSAYFEAPKPQVTYTGYPSPRRPNLPAVSLSRQSVVLDIRTPAPPRKTLQLGPATDLARGMQFSGPDRRTRGLNVRNKRMRSFHLQDPL